MAIAAARMGLHCSTIGHVDNEIFRHFLLDVLFDDRIGTVGMSKDNHVVICLSAAYETLLCWVFGGPFAKTVFAVKLIFISSPHSVG
ncbi:hypothetical protein F0562_002468 [Nyssa sinensis]|uniref:Carbohydrate kinase PfkB domain-containing protein n=1 Tax=Nyssa sinensis TaxID=561372 RepID=A0A5J5C7F4_9ASTE|nr:hypothetical protein F0562_002468 [Nyssa sinensis]